MKHLILLLLPLLVACKSIEFPTSECKKVLGKWDLVSKSGGITGKTIDTPKGQINTVWFKKDGNCLVQTQEAIHSKKFVFSLGNSIRDHSKQNYLIEYQEKNHTTRQSFRLIGGDTLVLSDECPDCYQYIYSRH